MSPTTSASAVQLTTATVLQYLASESGLDSDKRRVVLLRSAPAWEEAPELSWRERRARVAVGLSPLAIYELVLNHLAPSADGPEVLVVLTDLEEAELGTDLLAQVHKRRVDAVDIWDVVRAAFGAQSTDPRLLAENWATEALLDASPPGGWPRLAGGSLTRRHALASLALRRLGTGPYDPDASGNVAAGVELDVNTLLRWSLSEGGPARFLALRAPERTGLARFLSEQDQAGLAGRALLALVAAGHGADAVAFGLVCAALWVHAGQSVDAADNRARVRAERWLGEEPPAQGEALDRLVEAFAGASEEYLGALLLTGRSDGEDAGFARRSSAAVLDQAASLTRQFGAERAAGASPVLAAGLDSAFVAAGRALADGDAGRTAEVIQRLERHQLAFREEASVRIERVRMAHRLATWSAAEPTAYSETVTAGLDHYLGETSWVDLALEYIEAGGDPDHTLATAYDKLSAAVRARRQEIDRHFSHVLEAWTSSGGSAGTMLTVESFLSKVVAPVVRAGERRALLITLAGMSAAVAAELGEQLRQDWVECDPLPGAKDVPRRRGMAAVLPTTTGASLTSIFADAQHEEKALFRVFHNGDLRTEHGGEVFGPELYEAMTGDRTHVAVVLTAIDDRPAKEQKLGEGGWRLGELGALRELMQLAAEQGRAVLLTNDHEQAIDRHGDISLAEFAIPILAFLPFGAVPPKGWRELGNQQPPWWSPAPAMARRPAVVAPPPAKRPVRKRPEDADSPSLFEVAPAPADDEPASPRTLTPEDALIRALLPAELFQAQLRSLARKPDLGRVEKALRALLDAGGTLPVTALAQRIGLPVGRADGFSAVLRQLMNFDGVQTLETLPDGRTLRLNAALLVDQFELKEVV